jgi:hypothetical protein
VTSWREVRASRLNELIRLLQEQRDVLIDVATGGARIDDVNKEYQEHRRRIRNQLARSGIEDPIPWDDLWRWYAYWSSELPTYAERRVYIAEIIDPLLERIEEISYTEEPIVEDLLGPSTAPHWRDLEARLGGTQRELMDATTKDDFQDVGRRCREVLIDLGNVVFDESSLAEGEVLPGRNDAKARIGFFLGSGTRRQ